MRRLRARRRDAGLKEVSQWLPTQNIPLPAIYSSHRLQDARSLAMHVVIAAKIDRYPQLLNKAHENLRRWRERQGDAVAPWLVEWESLLTRSWPEVAGIMCALNEESTRLRQSSPFAGILEDAERRRILAAFKP